MKKLIFAICAILLSCSNDSDLQEYNVPNYLSKGGETFIMAIGDILPLEGDYLASSDEFVAKVSNGYILAKHVGSTDFIIESKYGRVTNKIIVNPSENIISMPVLNKYPSPPLPMQTSYLFSILGETSMIESLGTLHKYSYIASYIFGDVKYRYISEKGNRNSIHFINISLRINNTNLVHCTKFLNEHFEYLGQTEGSGWYCHKINNKVDLMVEFYEETAGMFSEDYRIELSAP